jgi:hypothetical protein
MNRHGLLSDFQAACARKTAGFLPIRIFDSADMWVALSMTTPTSRIREQPDLGRRDGNDNQFAQNALVYDLFQYDTPG